MKRILALVLSSWLALACGKVSSGDDDATDPADANSRPADAGNNPNDAGDRPDGGGAPGGMIVSAVQYGGTQADFAYRAVNDADGNLIIAGTFSGSVSFGGSALSSTLDNSGAPSKDIFIAKYSPNGSHLWSVSYGGTGSDEVWGLGVDSNGHVFISGQYNAPISFTAQPLAHEANYDAFVAKLAGGDGSPLWAKGYNGSNATKTWGLVVTSTNDVVVSFYYKGTANFGGGDTTATAGDDMVLARYSGANGSHTWSREYGGFGSGAADDQITAVAIDGRDNLYITGYFNGTLDFGGSSQLTQAGDGRDQFVASFTSAGGHRWSKAYNSTGHIFPAKAAIDAGGDLIIAGRFSGTASFGGPSFENSDDLDIYLVKYDGGTGNHAWTKRWAGAGYIGITGMAAVQQDVVVSGFYNGDISVDGALKTNAQRTNLFAARVSGASGDVDWMTTFGDDAGDGGGRGRAISVGNDARVYFLASFNDNVVFGAGNDFTSANGVEDIAIVELTP